MTDFGTNRPSLPSGSTSVLPHLAGFKRPRHCYFINEIPSNSTGKVEREKLREKLEGLLDHPLD